MKDGELNISRRILADPIVRNLDSAISAIIDFAEWDHRRKGWSERVPESIREVWDEMSQDAQAVAYVMACYAVDRENDFLD